MLRIGGAALGVIILTCLTLESSAAYASDAFGVAVCSAHQEGCDLWAGTSGLPAQPSVSAGARPSMSRPTPVACPTVGTGALPCWETAAGWAGADGCRYEAATDFVPSAAVAAEEVTPGVRGSWYSRSCGPADFDVVWLPDTAGAAPSPAAVARLAVQRLRLPTPEVAMSPGLGVPQLVGVPVWLWLGGVWGAVSATAAVPGVSVTATARPQTVTWDFGVGGTVSCAGPGSPFRPGVDDPAAASPTCGVVFTRSSAGVAGGRFPVRVTVAWQVGWAGAGAQGAAGGLVSTATSSVAVTEVQALAVPAGGGR